MILGLWNRRLPFLKIKKKYVKTKSIQCSISYVLLLLYCCYYLLQLANLEVCKMHPTWWVELQSTVQLEDRHYVKLAVLMMITELLCHICG